MVIDLGGVMATHAMATQHAMDEAEIRQRIAKLTEAIRAMDIERVMPIYAPDIVSFDVEPPLRHIGSEAKKKNWQKVFAAYEHPLEYELRDLSISAGDDVAFGHTLARLSGTLKDGTSTGYWVRWTMGLRKIGGKWLIAHDQISTPLDIESGEALLNLEP
jgi:uncharacterized protein (TIGR02246 family)